MEGGLGVEKEAEGEGEDVSGRTAGRGRRKTAGTLKRGYMAATAALTLIHTFQLTSGHSHHSLRLLGLISHHDL